MGTRNSTTARLLIVSLALATPVAAQKHHPPRAQQRAERREERQAARPPQPPAHHAGEWLRQHKACLPINSRKLWKVILSSATYRRSGSNDCVIACSALIACRRNVRTAFSTGWKLGST